MPPLRSRALKTGVGQALFGRPRARCPRPLLVRGGVSDRPTRGVSERCGHPWGEPGALPRSRGLKRGVLVLGREGLMLSLGSKGKLDIQCLPLLLVSFGLICCTSTAMRAHRWFNFTAG